jgi:ribose 5-phosphate isomerase B
MKLTIGSDHRGYRVKQKIVDFLNKNGHSCNDVGTNSDQSVDYPDIAQAVSRDVCAGDSARGILICGTGIGMAIAANKYPGVRGGRHERRVQKISKIEKSLDSE